VGGVTREDEVDDEELLVIWELLDVELLDGMSVLEGDDEELLEELDFDKTA
jgi:hypothetical protein